MAYIQPVLGHQLLIQIGDGGVNGQPETFKHANVVNTTRGVTFSTETAADPLVNLSDQSLPAGIFRRVISKDLKIDGAGMMDQKSTFEWIERWENGSVFNAKITDGNFLITGKFVLTNFQLSLDRTKPGENQLTLEQAEPVTVTEVA